MPYQKDVEKKKQKDLSMSGGDKLDPIDSLGTWSIALNKRNKSPGELLEQLSDFES